MLAYGGLYPTINILLMNFMKCVPLHSDAFFISTTDLLQPDGCNLSVLLTSHANLEILRLGKRPLIIQP